MENLATTTKMLQVLFLEGSKSILRLSHIRTRLIGFPPNKNVLCDCQLCSIKYVSWYKILTSNQLLFLIYLQTLSQVSDTKCGTHLRLLTTVYQAIAPHDPIYSPGLIWLLPKISLDAIMHSAYF